jgi:hypothetical protein
MIFDHISYDHGESSKNKGNQFSWVLLNDESDQRALGHNVDERSLAAITMQPG